jgi:hypothetical protein
MGTYSDARVANGVHILNSSMHFVCGGSQWLDHTRSTGEEMVAAVESATRHDKVTRCNSVQLMLVHVLIIKCYPLSLNIHYKDNDFNFKQLNL